MKETIEYIAGMSQEESNVLVKTFMTLMTSSSGAGSAITAYDILPALKDCPTFIEIAGLPISENERLKLAKSVIDESIASIDFN